MDSLPISLDVTVNVSQAQAAIAYDMTLLCIVVPVENVTERIQFFTDYASALEATDPGSSLDWALKAFFSQTPRPRGVAVGQVDSGNDLLAEVALIQAAAVDSMKPIYGWILDRTYRDTADQADLSDWVQAQDLAVTALVTNNVLAYSADDETNIAFYAMNAGNSRTAVIYHDTDQYYPDVSILARMLAVDYAGTNAAITAKFKDLPGIPTVPLTATQLAALTARRCNTFTLIGNGNRTFRDGVTSLAGWYLDTVINLDNLQNEMHTAVFNVFLQTPKVPYTVAGQAMLVGAATLICNRYTTNGVLAPRDIPKASGGFTTLPSYVMQPSPVGGATASDRAARVAPPIQITAYEAGAMHTVTINVNAVQ